MKFALNIFPKGTLKNQKTDGAYIDGILSQNLNVYAKKINDDMHFLGIITGNDAVGNGKSTFATHVGCYLTNKINELHNVNNTFTSDNEFFSADSLIKGSAKLPKLSVIILDEGDDLTTHGMKELAVRLKRYFRKCRQLNQIVILILPSFFELPKFFALSRSHFLINVKFYDEYERGLFNFYSPRTKKLLYLKGKKEWDYDAYPCSFDGVFGKDYLFFPNVDQETKMYLKKKHEDMIDDSLYEEETKTKSQIEKEMTVKLFRMIKRNISITEKELSMGFGITTRTASTYLSIKYDFLDTPHMTRSVESGSSNKYNNILVKGVENPPHYEGIGVE